MSTTKPIQSRKGTSELERPRFSPGLLLEDEDLNAGVTYTREVNRLLFSRLFGCGVICGLTVEASVHCHKLSVTVHPGLALDCGGNPIHLPRPEDIELDPDCDPLPDEVWVAVCYHEKCCRPKDVSCGSEDEGERVPTRSRDGFELRLYSEQPECVCSCEAPEPGGQGKADCAEDDKDKEKEKKEQKAQRQAQAQQEAWPEWMNACRCYAGHLKGECLSDCACSCVALGRFKIPEDAKTSTKKDPVHLPVDHGLVRRIRPVLTGLLPCFETHLRAK